MGLGNAAEVPVELRQQSRRSDSRPRHPKPAFHSSPAGNYGTTGLGTFWACQIDSRNGGLQIVRPKCSMEITRHHQNPTTSRRLRCPIARLRDMLGMAFRSNCSWVMS